MSKPAFPKGKTLTHRARRGQEGINLIEKVVLEMHSMWTATGGLEIGIDGLIELFDRSSGEALGKTIAVQSKVQKHFANETAEGFDYYCDERDLNYWLQGNMPVLLVVSRPENGEAYWVSVKDYFSDAERRKKRRVRFSKRDDRFDADAYADLLRLGRDETMGLYLGPIPKDETLYSNLLPVVSFPKRIWVAKTEYKHAKELWPILNDCHRRIGGDWLMHEQSIVSFQNLSREPWSTICDPGACEDFDAWEWAYSLDDDRRRRFVDLLNRTLKDQLYPEVRFWPQLGCYGFSAELENAPIKKRYRSLHQNSELTVVSKYSKKRADGEDFVWLRHLAFRGQFRLFEDQWVLEITPTYVFTWDGNRLDRFHESRLSTIKRLEGNRAVLSSLLVWAETLAQSDDLFRTKPKIRFGDLLTGSLPLGIDDAGWLSGDPEIDPATSEDGNDLFDDVKMPES